MELMNQPKINISLKLRRAKLADMKIAYEWANDKTVRQFSFNKHTIEFPEHQVWFQSKLEDSKCLYYILVNDTEIIGSIRFDMNLFNVAIINYLIDPLYHGKGFGIKLLDMGMQQAQLDKPEIDAFYGYVLNENIPSIKIFEKLNFEKFKENEAMYRFEKKV